MIIDAPPKGRAAMGAVLDTERRISRCRKATRGLVFRDRRGDEETAGALTRKPAGKPSLGVWRLARGVAATRELRSKRVERIEATRRKAF